MAPRSGIRNDQHMIEASHLTKTFGRRTVVDDLSFRVVPGAVTGLLGPEGAGKTTTLRMILGLERPTAGSALINGRPYSQLERPDNSVVAMLGGKWLSHGWIGRFRRRQADGTVPAGVRRRAGMAEAALGDPDHYLFDEPFAGLGQEDAQWMRQSLRRLAAQGKAVLVTGHSLAEMAQLADNLLVLGNGRLMAATSVDEFISSSGGPAVRVRAQRQAELYDLLLSMGARVTPRISDQGVSLLVHGLPIARVADAAVNFGILELVEEDATLERALLERSGMNVPTVGTLARGGIT